MKINQINVGVLAYIGDAVYELEIRDKLIKMKILNTNKLQKTAVNYVSAKNQALFLEKLIKSKLLTKNELYTINRAKNYKTNSKPKYTDIITYHKATALEALYGMLYLENQKERIKIITNFIVGE